MLNVSSSGAATIDQSRFAYAQATGVGSSGPISIDRTMIAHNGFNPDGTTTSGDGIFLNGAAALTMTRSASWQNGNRGIEFNLTTGLTTASVVAGSSIWHNTNAGLYWNYSSTPSGLGPDGSNLTYGANNVYDNGRTFLPAYTQFGLVGSPSALRSDADWTGTFWGYVANALCNGKNHLGYIYAIGGGGPVSTLLDTGPPACTYDEINDPSPATSELPTYFKPPPPVYGGLPLNETFGCAECVKNALAILNSATDQPQTPLSGRDFLSAIHHVSDPVNPATGTLTESFGDVHLPGPGIPFDFIRTYNSRDTNSGILGKGWSTPYEASLTTTSLTATYRAGDGQVTAFARANISASWTGTASDLVLASSSASCGGVTIANKITAPDQRWLGFNTSGQLVCIGSRFGPPVTLAYASGQVTTITDSAGRAIGLTYDPTSHLLTKVSLPDGRHVDYGYTSGQLTSVTNMNGNATTLGYDSNGYLNSIEDALSHFPLRLTYDGSGRVVAEQDGENNVTNYTYTTDPTSGILTTDVKPPARGDFLIQSLDNIPFLTQDPLGRVESTTYDENLRPITQTDGRGNTTTMTYNNAGDLLSITAPPPLGAISQSWTYSSTNDPLTSTDGNGQHTTYSYATSASSDYQVGELKTITTPAGATTTYTYYTSGVKLGLVHTIAKSLTAILTPATPRIVTTTLDYDSQGNLATIVSPLGKKTSMTYDSAGRMLTRVDPRGNVTGGNPVPYTTTWTYDGDDNVASIKDPNGNITSFHRDAADRVDTMTTPDGVTRYAYYNNNLLKTTTDPMGFVETRTYDADQALASILTPPGSDNVHGSLTTLFYDSAGQLTSVVEPRGNVTGATQSDYMWTYGYDNSGNRTSETHPNVAGASCPGSSCYSENYVYDALDRLTEVDRPLGRQTLYSYDGNSNLTKITEPLGVSQTYGYNTDNQLTSFKDERSQPTAYTHFDNGVMASKTTALGNETTWTVNDDGLVSSMVDPKGNATTPSAHTWTYGYDAAGNVTDVTNPDQTSAAHDVYTYDGVNNELSYTDADGVVTNYAYDQMERLKQTEAVGSSSNADTKYFYDADGRLSSEQDPLYSSSNPTQHITTWNYNQDGTLKSMANGIGTWAYAYDAARNVTQETVPSGGTTTMTYDPMNRRAGVTYSDATPAVAYQYDQAGRRSLMTDGAGTETYQYDLNDHLTQVQRGSATMSYAYADGLNLTKTTYPNGNVYNYSYDNDERLANVQENGTTPTVTFGYNQDGDITSSTYPTSESYIEKRTFDNAEIIKTANSVTSGGSILVKYTNTVDAAGRPTQIDITRGTTTNTHYLTYDARGRLNEACWDGSAGCVGSTNYQKYSYNKNSDMTTLNQSGTSTTYTYNSANQITGASGGSTATYTYDGNGNLKGDGTNTFTYNLANEITSSSQGGTSVTMTYDGDGFRLSSITGGGGANLHYVWDRVGAPGAGIPQLATETDGSGSLVRNYMNGPLGAMSMLEGGAEYYFHHDTQGSITDVVKSNGVAQWKYDYRPFGTRRSTTKIVTTAPEQRLLYAGAYYDSDLSLYNKMQRAYDPSTGRFYQVDPASAPTSVPFASPYVYVGDQPELYTDPLGRCCDVGGAFSSVAGGVENTVTGTYDTAASGVNSFAGGAYDTGVSAANALGDAGSAVVDTTASGLAATAGYAYDTTAAGAEWALNHPQQAWGMASAVLVFVPGAGEVVIAGNLAIAAYEVYKGNYDQAVLYAVPGDLGAEVGALKPGCALTEDVQGIIAGGGVSAGDPEVAALEKALKGGSRAPELSAPYDTHTILDAQGNIKQVTTYDEFGRRARQYDIGAGTRHGEGYHTFEFGPGEERGARSDHLPFE